MVAYGQLLFLLLFFLIADLKGTVWQATLYSFIRFPRGNECGFIAVEVKSEFPFYGGSPSNDLALDMNVLEKLVTITRDPSSDKTVCDFCHGLNLFIFKFLIIGDSSCCIVFQWRCVFYSNIAG